MSLFIGNISRTIDPLEIEKEFKSFGNCLFKYKGSFAFAEYDKEEEASNAIDSLNSKSFGGRQIHIEWSKRSGKFDPKTSKHTRTKRLNIIKKKRLFS